MVGTILRASTSTPGYTLGADEAGRPLRHKYGRTAASTTPIPVKSQYNSLQIKVDRRMRGGLLVTNSYTLGRGYSYINGDGTGGTIPTPADIERSWQRTSNDSTHSFANSFLYLLPFGPDGKWLQEGVAGKILGDWQVTGVFSLISGTPIDFTAERGNVARAWQQPDAQRERDAESARRHRRERSVVRYVGLLRARAEYVGQRGTARSADWSGVCRTSTRRS